MQGIQQTGKTTAMQDLINQLNNSADRFEKNNARLRQLACAMEIAPEEPTAKAEPKEMGRFAEGILNNLTDVIQRLDSHNRAMENQLSRLESFI